MDANRCSDCGKMLVQIEDMVYCQKCTPELCGLTEAELRRAMTAKEKGFVCEHCHKEIKLEDAHAVKHDGIRFRHYCFGCLITPPAQEVK